VETKGVMQITPFLLHKKAASQLSGLRMITHARVEQSPAKAKRQQYCACSVFNICHFNLNAKAQSDIAND
jgi:hypothetical protein